MTRTYIAMTMRFVIGARTFFNVPLFILINEIQGKHLLRRIPCASHGRFNSYVFTFDLETGTVYILIIFQ